MRKTNLISRAMLVVLLAGCFVVAGPGAGVAAAGGECTDTGYPDGCPPPPDPDTDPECSLSTAQATPGDTVEATVTNVPGDTTVHIEFDGTKVGDETTTDAGEPSDVTIAFTVPDADPGRHTVFAILDEDSVACRFGNGADGLVLSAGQGRGRGGLPQTGVLVGGFLTIALALVLLGRLLLGASRSRGLRDRAGF